MLKIYSKNTNKVALTCNNEQYTYEEFNRYVLAMQAYFFKEECKRIAIVLPNGLMAYTAMWASYLSGGTFCTINPEYPEKRIKSCISGFKPDIILDNTNCDKLFLDSLVESYNLFQEKEAICNNEIVYVLMTSGSTGEPKGVCIYRDAFEEVISYAVALFGLCESDIGGQYSNVSFDMGICDVFSFFSTGVTVIPVIGMDKLRPASMIKKYEITFWYSVPTVLDLMKKRNEITTEKLQSLRTIAFGGAVLFERYVKELFAVNNKMEVINTYGPTEVTIFSSAISMSVDNYMNYCDGGTVCIGRPIVSVGQSLSDQSEVLVFGRHVMSGYLPNGLFNSRKDTDRNDAVFYTGDIVREKDEELYFVMRNDSQIKINGNRVDLCEIEAEIRSQNISDIVVIENEGKLVAILSPIGLKNRLAELKEYLKNTLPPYCMPSTFIFLETIPMNMNGKYDRQLLKEIAIKYANHK